MSEEEEEGLSEEQEENIFTKLQPRRSKGEVVSGGRGFPGEIQNGEQYTVNLGAPAVDIMNRMVMTFIDGQEHLDSEENWRAWCESNGCPTMGNNYDLFVMEMYERPSQHNLFQALRMRYNIDVNIAEKPNGENMHFYYDVTLTADTKDSLVAAVNYLVSFAPKKFKIHLCTPCDYRMNNTLIPESAIEQYIGGELEEGCEEEECEDEEEEKNN
ncbi:unnamed protein product [Hydatigera taeniaeformis]|uniref:LPD25 domain-containing protein n=1 Tax=Hydatigena taeniaeformis TaxID=6205 RepID=A0A0R3WJY9_HYDTA|nr:unnamed protein product [Hydatigera taeniaeformis]